jgi:hypothetical protein
MHKTSQSSKNISAKRKFSVKSIDSLKKNVKYQNKTLESKKRIPLIIKEI